MRVAVRSFRERLQVPQIAAKMLQDFFAWRYFQLIFAWNRDSSIGLWQGYCRFLDLQYPCGIVGKKYSLFCQDT